MQWRDLAIRAGDNRQPSLRSCLPTRFYFKMAILADGLTTDLRKRTDV